MHTSSTLSACASRNRPYPTQTTTTAVRKDDRRPGECTTRWATVCFPDAIARHFQFSSGSTANKSITWLSMVRAAMYTIAPFSTARDYSDTSWAACAHDVACVPGMNNIPWYSGVGVLSLGLPSSSLQQSLHTSCWGGAHRARAQRGRGVGGPVPLRWPRCTCSFVVFSRTS